MQKSVKCFLLFTIPTIILVFGFPLRTESKGSWADAIECVQGGIAYCCGSVMDAETISNILLENGITDNTEPVAYNCTEVTIHLMGKCEEIGYNVEICCEGPTISTSEHGDLIMNCH